MYKILVIFLFCLMSCNTLKLDSTPPVLVKEAYFIEKVIGTTIFVKIEEIGSSVRMDSIYFRKQAAKLKPAKIEGAFTAVFDKLPADLIMSGDSQEEYQNQLSTNENYKIPFAMAENESVVRYSSNGKIGYFKIAKLEMKKE